MTISRRQFCEGLVIGGALRLVMRRPKAITVEKGGPHQNVILRLKNPEKEARHGITGEDLAHRLRAHPEIPDRRGAATAHIR